MTQQHKKISQNETDSIAANANPGKTAIQLKDNREHSVGQQKLAKNTLSKEGSATIIQTKNNSTGLPDNLKSGIENLSGHSMDDVKVHYNSDKPARVNAHAYAQGTNIHIASGQEKHLAHEAWHVVQQKQGRVKPTLQMKGKVNVNDDKGLEKEADVMGNKAVSGNATFQRKYLSGSFSSSNKSAKIIQRQIQLVDADDGVYEETEAGKVLAQNTEVYYCKFEYGDKPVFVLKTAVDQLDLDIDAIYANINLNSHHINQGEILALYKATTTARFFTDDLDVTAHVTQKHFRLQRALNHPLAKDPNRTRGLQHRFADAEGVLFSKLSKHSTEEQLGALPPNVQFYQIPSDEWKTQIDKHSAFWTEVTANFAYGRHFDKRDITPRNVRSKFKIGNQSLTDHNNFNDDTHTAKLPTAGSQVQTTPWIDYKRYVNPVKRGKGQFVAMGKWNALAYAAYWFHHGHPGLQLDQDWEWLHVQGAQNGGATNITNLVAGTSTTNSRMIPWEDNINSWTNLAKPEFPLSVRYKVERINNTNLGKKIEIDVAAENGIPDFVRPIKKASPMNVHFDPLNGTSYDKISNKLTDKTLAKEAQHDSARKTQQKIVQDFLDSNDVKLKQLTIIGPSNYKGLICEFRRYSNNDNVVVLIGALLKEVVVPKWQLNPLIR